MVNKEVDAMMEVNKECFICSNRDTFINVRGELVCFKCDSVFVGVRFYE